MADELRRGSPAITAYQRARFIEHLAQTANVTGAARFAGFDRNTAYDWKARDPEFAAAWQDALQQATDDLEAEARRRAMVGVREPVVNNRGLVYDENDKPLYVFKPSDTLMSLLLKAHNPARFNPSPAQASANTIPDALKQDPDPEPDEEGPDDPVL